MALFVKGESRYKLGPLISWHCCDRGKASTNWFKDIELGWFEQHLGVATLHLRLHCEWLYRYSGTPWDSRMEWQWTDTMLRMAHNTQIPHRYTKLVVSCQPAYYTAVDL